jgi:dihydrofolate reductase
MRISLIVAMAANRVIGRDGTIPWSLPGEQLIFKRITWGHTLIMGRKTHEDIGRPLAGRVNIVVSRRSDYCSEGCLTATSLRSALELCPAGETEAFVIGGGGLFRESLALADRVYLTAIPVEVPGDTYFPEIPESDFAVLASQRFEGPQPYDFLIYGRIREAAIRPE